MDLYIGNKNLSSWSMRPWLVLEHFQIPFTEHLIPFDDFAEGHPFKQTMLRVSPTAKVPTLVDQGLSIWDSLAICEYLAERYPDRSMWSEDQIQRAHARSISAEMHSGFSNLRTLCPMNIKESLPEIGAKHIEESEALRKEIKRIEQIWLSRPDPEGFIVSSSFTIADAFYAPVVMRILSYQLPVSPNAQQYIQTILSVPAVKKWMEQAKHENLPPRNA